MHVIPINSVMMHTMAHHINFMNNEYINCTTQIGVQRSTTAGYLYVDVQANPNTFHNSNTC